MLDHANPDLAKLILTHNIEEQYSFITDWLKRQYNLDAIGFFLKNPGTTQAQFFAQNVSMKMVHNFEEMFAGYNHSNEDGNEILFFSQNGEALDMFAS
ncbi:MAG: hypothetical protein ACQ9MH_20220 [Nitrospinales bacterium]